MPKSLDELRSHPWPEPDWFDFSPLRGVIQQINQRQHHIRFRIGSVFEIGWQLRGMQEFLVDLATDPGLTLLHHGSADGSLCRKHTSSAQRGG